MLPVILYSCKTLSLTFREEYTLRAFEKGALRKVFGPMRDKTTWE
jgi:hypothetical protein